MRFPNDAPHPSVSVPSATHSRHPKASCASFQAPGSPRINAPPSPTGTKSLARSPLGHHAGPNVLLFFFFFICLPFFFSSYRFSFLYRIKNTESITNSSEHTDIRAISFYTLSLSRTGPLFAPRAYTRGTLKDDLWVTQIRRICFPCRIASKSRTRSGDGPPYPNETRTNRALLR